MWASGAGGGSVSATTGPKGQRLSPKMVLLMLLLLLIDRFRVPSAVAIQLLFNGAGSMCEG